MNSDYPDEATPSPSIAALEKLSRLMDSSIRLPGGYRIGWDGVIGLIPGIGDLMGLGISLYIVTGAYRAGASVPTMIRMVLNVALETVFGAIPIFGDLFDMTFKANNRNMALLQRQLASPELVHAQSVKKVWIVALMLITIFGLIVFMLLKLMLSLIQWMF